MRLTLVFATVGDGLADERVVFGSLKVSFLSRQRTYRIQVERTYITSTLLLSLVVIYQSVPSSRNNAERRTLVISAFGPGALQFPLLAVVGIETFLSHQHCTCLVKGLDLHHRNTFSLACCNLPSAPVPIIVAKDDSRWFSPVQRHLGSSLWQVEQKSNRALP
jgi:hypothetical protein